MTDRPMSDDERRLVASALRCLAVDKTTTARLLVSAIDTARTNDPEALRRLADRYAPVDPTEPPPPFDGGPRPEVSERPRVRPEVRGSGLSVDVYDLDGYPIDDEP